MCTVTLLREYAVESSTISSIDTKKTFLDSYGTKYSAFLSINDDIDRRLIIGAIIRVLHHSTTDHGALHRVVADYIVRLSYIRGLKN